jgi:hypothetical protein
MHGSKVGSWKQKLRVTAPAPDPTAALALRGSTVIIARQDRHRPRRSPPPAAQLLNLAVRTHGEHADRAHTDHDLVGWWMMRATSIQLPARLMSESVTSPIVRVEAAMQGREGADRGRRLVRPS